MGIIKKIKEKIIKRKFKLEGKEYYRIRRSNTVDCGNCAFGNSNSVRMCLNSPNCKKYIFKEVEK